jgi:hypothetical protein
MILVRSGRETSTKENPSRPGKGFSLYRTGLNDFSHLFVLNVFNVGHSAEA